MTSKMRRHLPGTFLTKDLGQGNWRLSRGEPAAADIFLRGADSGATEALRVMSVSDIDIEWRDPAEWRHAAETRGQAAWHDQAVVLTMTSAARRRSIETRSAIVHEPLGELYDVLPLVEFDARARRFWRRVFRLVRIPGGRHLLGLLARRTRGRQ
jgi:hypothetical protein